MADLLIVDDDADTAEVLGQILCTGHCVRIARDGREGLACISDRRPDLVLLDVEMPVLTGPQMSYELLVRDCGDEKIPIVLLSGILGLCDVAAIVGTPYFLAKPYALIDLQRLLDRALRDRIAPKPSAARR